jgi:hypothetical protein
MPKCGFFSAFGIGHSAFGIADGFFSILLAQLGVFHRFEYSGRTVRKCAKSRADRMGSAVAARAAQPGFDGRVDGFASRAGALRPVPIDDHVDWSVGDRVDRQLDQEALAIPAGSVVVQYGLVLHRDLEQRLW